VLFGTGHRATGAQTPRLAAPGIFQTRSIARRQRIVDVDRCRALVVRWRQERDAIFKSHLAVWI
jgi:hypothetical protein